MKTLADPEVDALLRERFVLAMHNQLPQLYCNNTIDPGIDRYPDDMIDRCPEGAGGGNIRLYVCTSDGRVQTLILGYWKKERFLAELRGHDASDHERRRDAAAGALAKAQENLMLRAHEEAKADLGKTIATVLERIEEEIYTKGKIG